MLLHPKNRSRAPPTSSSPCLVPPPTHSPSTPRSPGGDGAETSGGWGAGAGDLSRLPPCSAAARFFFFARLLTGQTCSRPRCRPRCRRRRRGLPCEGGRGGNVWKEAGRGGVEHAEPCQPLSALVASAPDPPALHKKKRPSPLARVSARIHTACDSRRTCCRRAARSEAACAPTLKIARGPPARQTHLPATSRHHDPRHIIIKTLTTCSTRWRAR